MLCIRIAYKIYMNVKNEGTVRIHDKENSKTQQQKKKRLKLEDLIDNMAEASAASKVDAEKAPEKPSADSAFTNAQLTHRSRKSIIEMLRKGVIINNQQSAESNPPIRFDLYKPNKKKKKKGATKFCKNDKQLTYLF
ncbi:hypothetical protein RFI_07427, partial [Reticulomyxa filosa]